MNHSSRATNNSRDPLWIFPVAAFLIMALMALAGCQHPTPPSATPAIERTATAINETANHLADALRIASTQPTVAPQLVPILKAAQASNTAALAANATAKKQAVAVETHDAKVTAQNVKYRKALIGPRGWHWIIGACIVLALSFFAVGYSQGMKGVMAEASFLWHALMTVISLGGYVFMRFGHWLANRIHQPQATPAATK